MPPMAAEDLTAAKRHMDFLLSEARSDATTLRTEMANARIAVAKQEGDLKELRQQAAELQKALDSKLTELTNTRSERDKVTQAKTDLQTQMQTQIQTQNGEIAKLRVSAGELDIVKAKVADLETQLAARTSELSQAKKDLEQQLQQQQQQQQPKPHKGAKAEPKGKKPEASASLTPPSQKPPAADKSAPAPTPKATPPEPARMAQEEHPPASTGQDVRLADSRPGPSTPGKLTVKPGESLSMIAQRFGVTVDQLKQANGLQRDQLEPGQLLIIPSMKPTP
jgi:LysM repeat protein